MKTKIGNAPFTWKQRENFDYRFEKEQERLRDRLDALQNSVVDTIGQQNGELFPTFGFISIFGLLVWVNADILIYSLGSVTFLLSVWNYWKNVKWVNGKKVFLGDSIILVEGKYNEGIAIDRWDTAGRLKWILSIQKTS